MTLRFLKAFILFSILFFSSNSFAQETHGNPQAWYLLIGNHDLNDKWTVGGELHMRFDDWMKDKQTFIIRPHVVYRMEDGLSATAGYSYIEYYPYGFYPAADDRVEHNIWEQIDLSRKYSKFTISHRYRWEHRFVEKLVVQNDGSIASDGFDYSNRFRYRITMRIPLTEDYFLNVFDELWVKSDDRLVQTQFDRNWLYGAMGRKISDKLSIQLAYLHQYIINSPNRYERHSGIMLLADFKF